LQSKTGLGEFRLLLQDNSMRPLIFIFLLVRISLFAQLAEPIVFAEKIHDFGEIAEEGGTADFEFTFINNSGRAIKILSVQASCGCTTPGWTQQPVASGKSGFVKVSFDPRGRPGYFSKSLTATTDFDANPILLQIKGQVKSGTIEESAKNFPATNGNLRFKFNSFNLGRIYLNKEAQAKEFSIYNGGDKAIHFDKAITGGQVKVQLPETINPKEERKIRISFDAKGRGEYGFITTNIEILTDDVDQPKKSFPVYATVEEYFAPLTIEESKLAPLLFLDAVAIDMGRARQGTSLEKEVIIKNTGKKELSIRAMQPNCKCISIALSQNKIPSGGEGRLKIQLQSEGRTGTQQKAVTIYSNDPRNPVQRITLTAYIEN
jgi:Protein of unknown function (DUF1573)